MSHKERAARPIGCIRLNGTRLPAGVLTRAASRRDDSLVSRAVDRLRAWQHASRLDASAPIAGDHPRRSSVPGEGVEPSRAEAHGFLRPARLPIPPSRPGRSRVTGGWTRHALPAFLAALAVGCTAASPAPGDTPTDPPPPSADRIAFLFDGSTGDADLVSGPALAGLELAARQAGGVDVEPVNVGVDPSDALAALEELGDDSGVAAAVVGPGTPPPEGAVESLARAGLPVVSLSWAWGPPADDPRLWLSLAARKAEEARALIRAAPRSVRSGPLCAAGDPHVMSRALLRKVGRMRRPTEPSRVNPTGIVDPERPGTAETVAARLSDLGCRVLVWTGGAEAAALLVPAASGSPELVATSRLKTDDGLALAEAGVRVSTVCACADVALSVRPALQRFVHDFQAESGSAPGPYAVEAYDAGRLLMEQLRLGEGTRGELVMRLAALDGFPGLVGPYARRPGSAPSFVAASVGVWRAAGSRWFPPGSPSP